jgi:hypothetical protein
MNTIVGKRHLGAVAQGVETHAGSSAVAHALVRAASPLVATPGGRSAKHRASR